MRALLGQSRKTRLTASSSGSTLTLSVLLIISTSKNAQPPIRTSKRWRHRELPQRREERRSDLTCGRLWLDSDLGLLRRVHGVNLSESKLMSASGLYDCRWRVPRGTVLC
ncbi:hypothetical protein F5146DRAFT_1037681 [Armillaria mellea]|nr:hypothetical protein F5146DRAFT_1037681 [Armillaria mellea]